MMTYHQIYERIEELRANKGWSAYRLIKESGISQSTYYNMMSRKSVPQIDLIQRICDGLNISLGDFFAGEKMRSELSPKEEELLELSESLSSRNMDKLMAYIQGLSDLQGKDSH